MRLGGEKEATYWVDLDAAYAANRRFGEAITAAEKARDLALATGDATAAQAAQARLTSYRNQLQQ